MFAAFDASDRNKAVELPSVPFPEHADEFALIAWLDGQANDLEPAAISLHPVIGDVLKALRATRGCTLARMSGSGATCFGLFDGAAAAAAAARSLQHQQPAWWVRATILSENFDGNSAA